MLDDPEESFAAFRERLWAAYLSVGASRLILDVRYNSGGDGSLLLPFVHDVIRRETLTRPGGVVALLGRKTFSARVLASETALIRTFQVDVRVIGKQRLKIVF